MRFRTGLAAAAAMLLVLSSAPRAATVSKKLAFDRDKDIVVNLVSEGVELKTVRFSITGGTSLNPLRSGSGPQALIDIKNVSDHGMHVAAAVAFFDAAGNLVGAAEGNNIGTLDPGEPNTIKITMSFVKRAMPDAKTFQIALETWR